MKNVVNKYKRIAVFFLYDPQGIADNSVLYFLEQARPYFAKLLVVVNGNLIDDSKKSIHKIADNLLIRQNKGYDAWAYKAAIDHLRWEQIENYDELTLFNFTNFGPLYSLSEMFDVMDTKNLDFWGITKHHEVYNKQIQIPEHIQSHWISIRKSLFDKEEFKTYWQNLPSINSYYNSIYKHEVVFTKYFSDKGFKWDVYANTDNLKEYTSNPSIYAPLKLLRDYRCPTIKKKCFFNCYDNVLNFNSGEEVSNSFEYIKNNLTYNIDYIWENILRLNNLFDIKNNLHLNNIISSEMILSSSTKFVNNKTIALIIHIYFPDLIEYCFSYAKSIPPSADVYITTNTKEKRNLIFEKFKELKCNNLEIRVIENRGRDVGALLVGCKDVISKYDLICFAHDKKTSQLKPLSLGESFSYRCWENVLKDKIFVNNVIETFDRNKNLGLLFSPPPYHNPFNADKWGDNFEAVKTLANKLNIKVSIDVNKQPIVPIGTIFWFRPKALKKLVEYGWEYNDFPSEPNQFDGTIIHAIERLYSYAGQSEGYYSAWGMSENFAKMEIEGLSWFYVKSGGGLGVRYTFKMVFKTCVKYLEYNYPSVFRIISPIYIILKKMFKWVKTALIR